MKARAASSRAASAADITAVVQAQTTLGAMEPAVQAIAIAAAEAAKNRAGHSGIDPSSNVIMPNGQTLAQWFALMEAFRLGAQVGPDAPSLTTAPTLSIGPQGIIQSGGYETAGALTSHPITFTTTMVAGHFAWIGMFTAPGGSITSVTDNLGGVWTAVDAGQGSGTARLIVYYRANLPTGVTGVTIVTPSTEMLAIWQERDDIQLTSPKDVSAGAVWGAGTAYSSGAVAATTGDGIAIGIAETEDGSGITLAPDSPWATFTGTGLDGIGEVHSSAVGGFVAAARTTTNGTTPAFTGVASSSASGWACIVVFKKLSTGSVAVGDDVTITPGSVTNGVGGDHTNEFLVMGLDPTNGQEVEVPGTKIEKDNGLTTTFKVGATLYQKRFYAVQTPIDTVTLQRGNSKPSELSAVVSGTLPANTTAPTLSPSGSQAPGTQLTIDVEDWTGAVEYGIQLVVGGVPVGNRVWQAGTTLVVDTNSTYSGLGVTSNVVGRSALGLESAPVNASNTVTITGSATGIVYSAGPTWPANLYLDTQADFGPATVSSGTTSDGPAWDFYKNGTNPENLLPRPVLYPPLNAHNSIDLFTPQSAGGVIVGDVIYILEKRRAPDGNIYSVFSAGKAVTLPPGTLGFSLSTQGEMGFSFTAGVPLTTAIVGTIVGGTGPFNVSSSGLASIGLSVEVVGNQVLLIGTPTAAAAASYTITVTDSVGASTQQSIVIQVSSSGVLPLTAPSYASANVAISGDNTAYNGVTPKYYNGQIVLGPNGDGRNRHRLIQGAPSISNGVRNELLFFNENLVEGQTTCFAFDLLFDIPGEFPVSTDGEFLVMQTHTSLSGNTQPDIACFVNETDGQINFRVAGQDAAPSGGTTTTDTQAAYFGGQALVQGLRYRFIVEHVAGWLPSHGPRINIWVRNGSATTWTLLVSNYTVTPNTYNYGGDPNERSYFRIGGYKWATSTTWLVPSVSWVSSPLYIGYGTNLFDRAVVSLAQLPQ